MLERGSVLGKEGISKWGSNGDSSRNLFKVIHENQFGLIIDFDGTYLLITCYVSFM